MTPKALAKALRRRLLRQGLAAADSVHAASDTAILDAYLLCARCRSAVFRDGTAVVRDSADADDFLRRINAALAVHVCANKRMAQFVRAHAGEHMADFTVLWEFPREDHAAWLAAGMGDMGYDEYLVRLDAVEAELRHGKHNVDRLRARVADVRAFMAAEGLPNTPQGRATATGLLHAREKLKGGN